MSDDRKPDTPTTERLEEALEQLEVLDNANRTLMETLSHDLRTPLNTIIGFADMIEQETLGPVNEPKYRGYVTDILAAGRSMLDIVDGLLDRKRFEDFKESGKDFRHLIELAPDLICVCQGGKIKMINPAGADMLGAWPPETLIDRNFIDFVHADYHEILGDGMEHLVAEKMRVPMQLAQPDGGSVDVEVAAIPYEEDPAGVQAVMLIARDVSQRNRALKKAAARENHIRKIMDTVVDGIITFERRGVIETINPAAERIFGYDSGELIGRNVRILMDEPLAADHAGYVEDEADSERTRILGTDYQVEGRRRDGSKFPVEIAVGMLKDGPRRIYIGALRDITERKEHEERLRYLATRDPLTRMPNRRLFTERLEEAIAQADESGGKFAVLFLDLDHFKNINDAMGHVTGDMVLQAVGRRLEDCVRDGDTVAHLSGDEFPIILRGVETRADAEAMAAVMQKRLSDPFFVDGREIYTTVSIGVVLYPDSAGDIGELMRNVDTAAHQAKKQGRDTYQFYSERLSAGVQRRLEIETGLRHAIENNQFTLAYQAKVDLDTRKISGAEALLRWESPEIGTVSPDEFIPIAEETGLIVAIGHWVLQAACRDAAHWTKLIADPVQVGVNLSAFQFRQGNLIASIENALAGSGLPADLLDLELTESMLVENPEETIESLNRLKEMGMSVSIDDFGTGYSSLSYLTRFPLDSLKVDRAFVANLPDDRDAVAIVRAIISMGKNLGLNIIAEGVENENQVGFLHALGCHVGQGYLFSKPIPAEDFQKLLTANRPVFLAAERA
ncbi:MAG: EAL domain-containing protein [Proteobacteria bacterium]|nr:EAL domain-containing protein [Pseudomonadota bacterium]